MSQITTHVLDTALGHPAAGVHVVLQDARGAEVASGVTDSDGRIGDLGPSSLPAGTYRLRFATGDYVAATTNAPAFFPEVVVTFAVPAGGDHHHIPLLLSPFGYSTYRGS